MLDLISEIYKELTFTEKETDDQLLLYIRSEIYKRACQLGVFDCIIQAVQQFETWKNSPNPDKHNLYKKIKHRKLFFFNFCIEFQ